MTAAYAAFANAGMVQAPTLVRRVETTEGEVLFEAKQEAQQGVSPETAFLISNMMVDVVNAGTGAPARSVGFRLPAAGKTGTTNDYHDAWFVGFTPSLAAGVWIGYDQPRTIIGGGYASVLAVPVWGRFMAAATSKDRPEWFSAPTNVTSATICRLSGKLATDSCNEHVATVEGENAASASNVYSEYFVQGTEPTESCPIHRRLIPSPLRALAALVSPGRVSSSSAAAAQPPPAERAEAQAPAQPQTAPQQEEPKKRGFWGRLFGGNRK
jgi:penicillin-binding protein 1A